MKQGSTEGPLAQALRRLRHFRSTGLPVCLLYSALCLAKAHGQPTIRIYLNPAECSFHLEPLSELRLAVGAGRIEVYYSARDHSFYHRVFKANSLQEKDGVHLNGVRDARLLAKGLSRIVYQRASGDSLSQALDGLRRAIDSLRFGRLRLVAIDSMKLAEPLGSYCTAATGGGHYAVLDGINRVAMAWAARPSVIRTAIDEEAAACWKVLSAGPADTIGLAALQLSVARTGDDGLKPLSISCSGRGATLVASAFLPDAVGGADGRKAKRAYLLLARGDDGGLICERIESDTLTSIGLIPFPEFTHALVDGLLCLPLFSVNPDSTTPGFALYQKRNGSWRLQRLAMAPHPLKRLGLQDGFAQAHGFFSGRWHAYARYPVMADPLGGGLIDCRFQFAAVHGSAGERPFFLVDSRISDGAAALLYTVGAESLHRLVIDRITGELIASNAIDYPDIDLETLRMNEDGFLYALDGSHAMMYKLDWRLLH